MTTLAAAQAPPLMQPLLPAVPEQQPRPAEGAKGEGWNTTRAPEDAAAVSTFIDSLKGTDAVLQLVVGQGRVLTTRQPIATERGTALIAVGDPTVVDFEIMPNPRMVRLIGKRAGVTDLSITTSDDQVFGFAVQVGYDLDLLRAQLLQVFPEAHIRLGQIREHIVVEGQARSPAQVTRILQMIEAYLTSVQVAYNVSGSQPTAVAATLPPPERPLDAPNGDRGGAIAYVEEGPRPNVQGTFAPPQIINLLRVPGVQQVMLQVRIAELNRTALRQVGADILAVDPSTGNIVGTQIGGGIIEALGEAGVGGLAGSAAAGTGTTTTAFGIFPSGDWNVLLRILRSNSVLNILAEPNLIAMTGHKASFLAGGQFPVPVPQVNVGSSTNVTVEFKDFGVRLDFIPYIQDDDSIRLHVAPEVSSIDFAIGTTLVVGGDRVPGINTRKAETTVEMRQGQTLAIAGLLQVDLDARTDRIPGLGDLPYIGPLFSNTSHKRVEKELVVLVTPLLVSPMAPCEVGPLPGSEILDPNNKEFFLLNRIEGRTGRAYRPTTNWDNPLGFVEFMNLERRCTCGAVGFSQ